MQVETFIRRSTLPVSADEAFAWHRRPGALERLTPPWEDVQILRRTGGIANGDRLELRVSIGPLPVRWVAEHRDCEPGRQFRDVQLHGPFALWDHLHRFEPLGPDQCVLEDRIEYAVPGGPLGRWLGGRSIAGRLTRMFEYRHAITIADLAAHAKYHGQPLTIGVSGSSGLIGSSLVSFLGGGGHSVRRIVRGSSSGDPDRIAWDPEAGRLEVERLNAVDVVVHLAGENIAARRWTEARKTKIRESRVAATRQLCESLARLASPPKTLVCASAVGFYGDRGDRVIDEDEPVGEGFLADVCRQWEMATEPASRGGIRVVLARFGIVLSPRGGALARLLPLFRWGLGGRLGQGNQYWSWISLDDAVGAIHHAIVTPTLSGPMNATTSQPVRNADFAATLAEVLHRPALLPAPAFALRLTLGEMANEMLLASTRVIPRRLFAAGYQFRHPTLDLTLRHLLGR
jgi:uncharacterized protein (TIGR01777 family)